MRSPIGPILVLLGLATTLVAVLLLVQTIGLRGDLESARGDVAALQAQVAAQEPGVTTAELQNELEELRTWTRDLMLATGTGQPGTDPGQPAGGSVAFSDVVDRLDEVLARITALDRRVDDICRGVPVC